MTQQDDFEHFTCLVIGENPEQQMLPYDGNKEVEPYVVFHRSDAHKMKLAYIEQLKIELNNDDLDEGAKEYFQLDIEATEDETDEEFFENYTARYRHDEITGDALSTENPKGKWRYFNEGGKAFSNVFRLKDGSESYQAKKGDIDWGYMHQRDIEKYERTWDLVMEGVTPVTKEDWVFYENMKNRTAYFEKFGSKEEYAAAATYFWTFACLSEMGGWQEMNYLNKDISWVCGFYKVFIETLPDDTLLTIYECGRKI